MIQEQVLMMILSATGQLPDSFAIGGETSSGGCKSGGGSKSGGSGAVKSSAKASMMQSNDQQEQEILKQVVE